MFPRYLLAAILGGTVTFGLFFLMQELISQNARPGDKKGGKVIEFVRLKKDETVQEKKREIPDKTPPEQPPPPPPMNFSQSNKPSTDATGFGDSFGFDNVDLGDGPAIGTATAGDSDVIPLVRVDPAYPIRAQERGIEGWVTVQFTISPRGTIVDPKVIAYEPSTIFNSSALRAIKRWRYNPKIVDGKPVSRPGVKVKLRFKLPTGQG